MTGVDRMISVLKNDPGNPPVQYDVAQVVSFTAATRVCTITVVGQTGSVANCPVMNPMWRPQTNEYIWILNRPGAIPIVMGPITPSASVINPAVPPYAGAYFTAGVNAFGYLTIPHGLPYTPNWAIVTPAEPTSGSPTAADILFKPNVDSIDGTNIFVLANRTDSAGNLAGSGLGLYWLAGKSNWSF